MRYSPGLNYSLVLHDDAIADLDRIYIENEDAGAEIEVFLEEAKLNQNTLDNLTRNNYVQYVDPQFDVKELVELKRLKYNLWRVRMLWLKGPAAKYRIIYAFHPNECRYYILGIVNRQFNYDLQHERTIKILHNYDQLNIPRY